ncbi:hypothetical protein M407DRAFT_33734 [Tulasnella calospora MUT 4182]|uniref:Uncharacterized protein n=1 Tax=Tulasnella calospora MUT 4182 TaxID=1051891 RepID=A0A0C3Q1T8_9AGAM|nr:hypothetical protein M407DRAFT_33734 [Tulasnella calospora MUT 4182]
MSQGATSTQQTKCESPATTSPPKDPQPKWHADGHHKKESVGERIEIRGLLDAMEEQKEE